MSSDVTTSVLWQKGYRLNARGEWYKPHGELQGAVPKPAIRHDLAAAPPRKAPGAPRIIVRVTSYRIRLLDPDNLCPKYLIDGLRYAGLVPNDREEDIALEVRQVKDSNERTEIELLYPPGANIAAGGPGHGT